MSELSQKVVVDLLAKGDLRKQLDAAATSADKLNQRTQAGREYLEGMRQSSEKLKGQLAAMKTRDGLKELRERAKLEQAIVVARKRATGELAKERIDKAKIAQDKIVAERAQARSENRTAGRNLFAGGTAAVIGTTALFNPWAVDRFTWALKDMGAAIGQDLEPLLVGATKVIRGLADAYVNLEPAVRSGIADVVGVGIAWGGFSWLTGMLGPISAAKFALGGLVALLGNPLTAALAAAAAGLGVIISVATRDTKFAKRALRGELTDQESEAFKSMGFSMSAQDLVRQGRQAMDKDAIAAILGGSAPVTKAGIGAGAMSAAISPRSDPAQAMGAAAAAIGLKGDASSQGMAARPSSYMDASAYLKAVQLDGLKVGGKADVEARERAEMIKLLSVIAVNTAAAAGGLGMPAAMGGAAVATGRGT